MGCSCPIIEAVHEHLTDRSILSYILYDGYNGYSYIVIPSRFVLNKPLYLRLRGSELEINLTIWESTSVDLNDPCFLDRVVEIVMNALLGYIEDLI